MDCKNESMFKRPGHVTMMAVMPIYGKNPLQIFSETSRLMTFELNVHHQGLGRYKVYSDWIRG